jgi:hypothetical protein
MSFDWLTKEMFKKQKANRIAFRLVISPLFPEEKALTPSSG